MLILFAVIGHNCYAMVNRSPTILTCLLSVTGEWILLSFRWNFQSSAGDINYNAKYCPRNILRVIYAWLSSNFINLVKYKLIGSPTNPVNLELRSNLKKVGIITPAVNMMTAKRKSIWITRTFASLSLQI